MGFKTSTTIDRLDYCFRWKEYHQTRKVWYISFIPFVIITKHRKNKNLLHPTNKSTPVPPKYKLDLNLEKEIITPLHTSESSYVQSIHTWLDQFYTCGQSPVQGGHRDLGQSAMSRLRAIPDFQCTTSLVNTSPTVK